MRSPASVPFRDVPLRSPASRSPTPITRPGRRSAPRRPFDRRDEPNPRPAPTRRTQSPPGGPSAGHRPGSFAWCPRVLGGVPRVRRPGYAGVVSSPTRRAARCRASLHLRPSHEDDRLRLSLRPQEPERQAAAARRRGGAEGARGRQPDVLAVDGELPDQHLLVGRAAVRRPVQRPGSRHDPAPRRDAQAGAVRRRRRLLRRPRADRDDLRPGVQRPVRDPRRRQRAGRRVPGLDRLRPRTP